MNSAQDGPPASGAEVTNVSAHGFWLLVGERELFVDFEAFPSFREASIAQLVHVETPSPDRLRWPDLDEELDVDSIEKQERHKLMGRGADSRSRRSKRSGDRR